MSQRENHVRPGLPGDWPDCFIHLPPGPSRSYMRKTALKVYDDLTARTPLDDFAACLRDHQPTDDDLAALLDWLTYKESLWLRDLPEAESEDGRYVDELWNRAARVAIARYISLASDREVTP